MNITNAAIATHIKSTINCFVSLFSFMVDYFNQDGNGFIVIVVSHLPL